MPGFIYNFTKTIFQNLSNGLDFFLLVSGIYAHSFGSMCLIFIEILGQICFTFAGVALLKRLQECLKHIFCIEI